VVTTTTEQTTAYKIFVGGEWGEAASGKTFEVVDPATLAPIATVADGGKADMRRAIDAAVRAQPLWAETTPSCAPRRAACTSRKSDWRAS